MIDYKLNVKLNLKKYFDSPDKKITQRELAAKLDVNEVVVSKWLKDGDNAPTLNYIPDIANALDISIYQLLGIKDPSSLSPDEQEVIDLYRSNEKYKAIVDNAKELVK